MRWQLLLLTLVRCGGPVSSDALSSADACPPSGSVVITELAIRGASYVELYNSGRQSLELSTIDLAVAGSGAPRDVQVSGRIAAGGYAAVPVSALADAGGSVTVSCAGALVDEVHYERADTDVLGLDGAQAPDARLNDSPAHWCSQPGSAGGANPACGAVACTTGEAPTKGDLVISEVMRDPVGADAVGEWIELRNTSHRALVLDGLILEETAGSTRRFTLTAPACFTLDDNALIVVPLGGEELPRFTRGSGLFNDAATLVLFAGETVLDEAEIQCGHNGSTCALVDGAWCESTTPSPGEENDCGR